MEDDANMYDRDPREIGTYGLSEAASYLRLPPATLRRWVTGAQPGAPLIALPDPQSAVLSFTNLVEAHVLSALRRVHGIRFSAIREAVQYVTGKLDQPHPLARTELVTDGVDLFVEHLDGLVNVSRRGQFAMREVLNIHLRRVERDAGGLAIRLYPFTRTPPVDGPRVIVIDPRISFGRPTVAGTGVPTDVLLSRYRAGESVDELADDYGCARESIEEVLRGAIQRAA